jgi:hypothetical protein
MSAGSESKSERIQARTILWAVLAVHPAPMTDAEVVEALACDPPASPEKGQVEIGIRQLLSVGLLRREGGSLMPTPASLFLDDLLGV